ncbi:MAG TPA: GntR family transcriptional regulator [Candidatus Butyricicoccus avicola]|nr:GntR family transcriptional regulator [Candidatus Butyricicoccus avicola]
MLGINYRDGRPIYEQVVDEIEHMVVHGVLEPDSQLPSVRQMAAELSINPNTIQRAYSELESRGVIYSVKGKGNFVSPNAAALRERRLRDLQVQITELVRTARELGVSDAQLMEWMKGEGEIE